MDRFFGPFSTWTVQNSLDNAVARLPLIQGSPPLLINSTTGHYNSTGMQVTSLWSAFLASVQQGRALLKHPFLRNAHVRIATPTGNTPEASEVRTPSIFRTRSGGPMMSAVEEFHI